MELLQLVENFSALREKRKSREKIIAEMKVLEDRLAGMIMNQMSVSNMKTINFEGIGRVETTSRDHVEIRDTEKLAKFILAQAVRAHKNGTPLSDALTLLQQRAAIGTVKELIAQGYSAENMGVEVVQKPNIKFTKA